LCSSERLCGGESLLAVTNKTDQVKLKSIYWSEIFGAIGAVLRIDRMLESQAWKCAGTLATPEDFLCQHRCCFHMSLMFQKP
jgi:hypothetical protein